MSTEAQHTEEGFFERSKGPRGMYFHLFDGSLCIKSPTAPTDGQGWDPEPVETTNPRTKATVHTYVKRFDRLVCRIVDVRKRRREFESGGKVTNWNFTLMAGSKKAVLQTVWMDQLLRKILKVAPNIDFEKPIMLGAFSKIENGKTRQRISIRQGGTSADSNDWSPVPFYWENAKNPDGSPDWSSEAKGADGTVMPGIIHDEDDDTWDSKAQEKFLAQHFVENTLPKIKAIAERLGIRDDDSTNSDGGAAGGVTHTGTVEESIPVIMERPENVEATSVANAMTSKQSYDLRRLAKQIDKDVDVLAQKFVGVDFDDMSKEAASYLKYKIEKYIDKTRTAEPEALPEPETKKATVSDDDDWEPAAPPTSHSAAQSFNDDVEF